MAPTNTNATTKGGTNPAPDYAVLMNRIQTKQSQLSATCSFLSSLHGSSNTNNSSNSSSHNTTNNNPRAFSSLTQNANAQTLARARAAEDEADFAEGMDPRAGIGLARSRTQVVGVEDRDTQMLRGRLLGKRKIGGGGGGGGGRDEKRYVRKAEEGSSEEDEPGRGGLGRAKKRSRRVVEAEAEAEADEVREDDATTAEVPATTEVVEERGRVDKVDEKPEIDPIGQDEEALPDVRDTATKKKRKKKKKKKAKTQTEED